MTLNVIKSTLFVGNIWYHFETLHSTNDLAVEWLSVSRPKGEQLAASSQGERLITNTPITDNQYTKITEGAVITTFNQALGRGQMGNVWLAEPHQNIAFTVILQPTFLDAREQFHLNKVIALAVHDFFVEIFKKFNPALVHACKIKWSNDIYFYDQKMAGILIQNTLSGSRLQNTIVGIGLNINQLNFPNDINATSLKRELNHDFDLFALVEQLAKNIEQRYLLLKTGHFKKIHDEYLSKMYRFGIESAFQYPSSAIFRGTIIGVSATGRLEVLTTEGLRNFEIKEVKFVVE